VHASGNLRYLKATPLVMSASTQLDATAIRGSDDTDSGQMTRRPLHAVSWLQSSWPIVAECAVPFN